MADMDGEIPDTNDSFSSEHVKALIAAEVKRQLDALLPEAITQLLAKQKRLIGGMRSADPVRIPTDSRGLPLLKDGTILDYPLA